MNISKEIIRKMHRLAKLAGETKKLSGEIDQYFIGKGFDIDELRCGNGRSLEELEYGNDITDTFCIDAKNNFSDKNMWSTHLHHFTTFINDSPFAGQGISGFL